MNIADIDKNFKVDTNFDTSGLEIYNVLEKPFEVNGLIYPEGKEDKFKRLPSDIAKTVSEGVFALHANTSGGRVRFKTNSDAIAIFAEMDGIGKMSHFALTGSAGFDLYIDNKYKSTFVPPFEIETGYSSLARTKNNEEKNAVINFPLYSNVKSLMIGLDKGAYIKEPDKYKYDRPVVYYGHSITQGGCASRPGNSYQAIISRKLNIDFVNLGFSGSAMGEVEIAEYISTLDMKAFVYDYDHNAPTAEHLKNTHERMFYIIRRAHPNLPIVMISKSDYYPNDDTHNRREIIKETYQKAIDNGDKNVYFIDGSEMIREFSDDGATVDSCHPNDYGFAGMAKVIGRVLESILKD